MELVEPSAEYKDSFIDAVREFQADKDYTYRWQSYQKLSLPEFEKDFEAFVERERSHQRGENLPEGYVPCTEYWLIDDGKFVGRTTVRHRLNDRLLQIGGHIGFDIRPSMRGKGYGNAILELALSKAKELGIKRVLITHDDRNLASRKIILKYGGVLENQIPNTTEGFEGHNVFRYWVDIP